MGARRARRKTMRLGSRIRRLREQQEMTQGELVRRTGLQASYLSKVEHGLVLPGVENLDRIARAMGIALADVFVSNPWSGAGRAKRAEPEPRRKKRKH